MLGKRIIAAMIDYVLIFVPVFLLGFLLITFETILSKLSYGMVIIILFLMMFILAPIELICKDMMGKRSIGKKIMHLQISSLDGTAPTYKQLFIRNIFMLLSSVEIIIVLFLDKPRLGDKIAKTKVVCER